MLLRLLPLPLFFAATAWACLNTPGTDLDGRDAGSHYSHDSSHLRQRMQTPPELERRAQPVEPPDTAAKKLEAEALDLIYAGNYAAARVLLQKAETLSPDDYSIAANLGTACELLGDDAEALRWITEAVRRNPDSHRGTEWVHILVLKAKLRDAGSPRATFPPLIEVPERVTPETPLRIDGVARSSIIVGRSSSSCAACAGIGGTHDARTVRASGAVKPTGSSRVRCIRFTVRSWSGWTSEMTVPDAPARAVRPERCV